MAQVQVRFYLHDYRWQRGTGEQYMSLLPDNQLNRVRQFKHFKPFFNALAGKLLLRQACIEEGEPPEKLTGICYSTHGKPFHSELFHFNITHTDRFVAIAWSRDLTVGLDSERVRPKDPFLFTRQFNLAEMESFRQSPDPLRAFFCRWTQKEAIVKETGGGLTLPLCEITGSDPGVFHFRENTWFTRSVDVGSAEHIVHLAIQQKKAVVQVKPVMF